MSTDTAIATLRPASVALLLSASGSMPPTWCSKSSSVSSPTPSRSSPTRAITWAMSSASSSPGSRASWSAARHRGSRTYGWRRSSILAALINAVVLLVTMGGIAWEAVRRFGSTGYGGGQDRYLGRGGWHRHQWHDGAALHVRSEGRHQHSRGVCPHGGGRGPCRSAWSSPGSPSSDGPGMDRSGSESCIVAVVLYETWGLLRDSVNLALDAVPRGSISKPSGPI